MSSNSGLNKTLVKLRESSDGFRQSNVEEVLAEVQLLERHHSANSKLRCFGRRISPLIEFLTRFGPVIDTMVQYDPTPSALVWGAIKALLEAAQTSIRYFQSITDAVINLTDIVLIASEYENIFRQEPRVGTALKDVYSEILVFLGKIRKVLLKSSLALLRSIFAPFDVEFRGNLERLSRSVKIYEQEVELAHKKQAAIHIQQQDQSSKEIVRALDSIALSSLHDVKSTVRSKTMTWLAVDGYYEAHHHTLRKCVPGTCQWLLQDQIFQQWLHGSAENAGFNMLWIYGAPGVGKSVLCSNVIQYLQENRSSVPTAYFYCDLQNKSKSSVVNICATILLQILAKSSIVPSALEGAFHLAQRYGRSRISVADKAPELLKSILEDLPALYIVLDALDECAEMKELMATICTIAGSLPSVRFLLFSRDIVTIRKDLRSVPSIRLDSARNHRDIDSYLVIAVESLPFPDDRYRQRALAVLSQKSDGMFLFAHLGIQALRSAVNVREMLTVLETLPEGIENFYRLKIDSLAMEPAPRRSLARKTLLWLCSSVRPLTWPELQCALSWDSETRKFDAINAPFEDSALEICYPLIEHRRDSDTYHLTHHSIWEFLHDESNISRISSEAACFLFDDTSSNLEMAEAALAFLQRDEVSESIYLSPDQFPLARYVTDNWGLHLSSASNDMKLWTQYKELFSSQERRLILLARSFVSEDWPFPLQRITRIQKEVRSWTLKTSNVAISEIEDLIDIQKALFLVDNYQISHHDSHSASKMKVISTFERSMNFRELARMYTRTGKLETGIKMLEEELANIDKKEGKAMASKAWLLNSLGILYDQQGKTSQAETTQRKALAYQEEHLPRDSLDTILTMNELGRILRHLGKLEEAEALHLRALDILQAVFPSGDIHVTWTQNTLGRVLLKRGKAAEALKLHELAHASEVQTLGENHGYAIWSMSDIARCYHALGRDSEAIEAQKEVVERRVRMLGQEHPDTLWAMNSLGLLYEEVGNIHGAFEIQKRAYESQVAKLGESHPHTVWSDDVITRLKSLV